MGAHFANHLDASGGSYREVSAESGATLYLRTETPSMPTRYPIPAHKPLRFGHTFCDALQRHCTDIRMLVESRFYGGCSLVEARHSP